MNQCLQPHRHVSGTGGPHHTLIFIYHLSIISSPLGMSDSQNQVYLIPPSLPPTERERERERGRTVCSERDAERYRRGRSEGVRE